MKLCLFFGFFFVYLACFEESLLGNSTSISQVNLNNQSNNNGSYGDITDDLANSIKITSAPFSPPNQKQNDAKSRHKKEEPFFTLGKIMKNFNIQKQKVTPNQPSGKVIERKLNNLTLEENMHHPNEIVYGISHDRPWHVEKTWGIANFSFINNKTRKLKEKIVNETLEKNPPYFYAVLINPNYDRSLLFAMNTFLTAFGIVLNIIFISIHFHEQALYNFGSVFIANMGVANVIVTCCVPGYAWIKLAAQADPTPANCERMWIVAISAIHVTFLSHLIAGIELILRMEHRVYAYGKKWTTWLAATLLTLIWILSVSASTLGFDFSLDYDFCERKHNGNLIYRLISALFFYVIPTTIILSIYIRMLLKYLECRKEMFYFRAFAYRDHLKLALAHFFHFISIFVFWSSFAISITFFPDTTQSSSLYLSAWIGILYFVFGHLIYIITNRYYRRAYMSSVRYCLLKRSIGGFESNRRVMAHYEQSAMRDVRAHVLLSTSNPSTPKRVRFNRSRDTVEII